MITTTPLPTQAGQLRLFANTFSNEASLLSNKPCFLNVAVTSGATALTELLQVHLRYSCKGEMLAWLNPLGGYDYWLFEGYQQAEFTSDKQTIDNQSIMKDFPQSYINAVFDKRVINQKALNKITFFSENVESQYLTGIRWLFTSPAVFWLTTPKIKGIIVESNTFVWKDESKKVFDFSINFYDIAMRLQSFI